MPRPAEAARPLWVGLDLDGCFYDFAAAFWEACDTLGYAAPPRDRRASTCWEFYTAAGHDLADFLAICDHAADEGLLWSLPYENRAEWRTLYCDPSVKVHVVTDRSFGSDPMVSRSATKQGLVVGGLRYDKITFTAAKADAAEHLDLHLDDKLSNYDDLDAAGVNVWLLNRPWNTVPGDRRRRVATIADYVAVVHATVRARQRSADFRRADMDDAAHLTRSMMQQQQREPLAHEQVRR